MSPPSRGGGLYTDWAWHDRPTRGRGLVAHLVRGSVPFGWHTACGLALDNPPSQYQDAEHTCGRCRALEKAWGP